LEGSSEDQRTGQTEGPASLAVKKVVTVFVSHHGRILLLRRSNKVGSYRGRWAGISGYIELNEAPLERALKEISEEVKLDSADVSLAKVGRSFPALDEDIGTLFVVHPFLFSTDHVKISLDWEHDAFRWVRGEDLSRFETVPKLDEALERVLEHASVLRSVHPAVLAKLEEIRHDRTRGASELSRQALDAMRLLAEFMGAATSRDLLTQLRVFGRELMDSRPSMAALTNLVGRLLHLIEVTPDSASSPHQLRQTVTDGCQQIIEESQRAVYEIALRASDLIQDGMTIFAHSRSATVFAGFRAALNAGKKVRAIVTESRPLFEGRTTAQELSALGIPVTLAVDAAVGHLMPTADLCIVGADSILSDGTVVNKIGTFPLAMSAREHGKPFIVLCEKSKFNLRSMFESQNGVEEMDPTEILPYASQGPLTVRNPYFDKTPSKLVSRLIIEDGDLSPQELPRLFRKMLGETYL